MLAAPALALPCGAAYLLQPYHHLLQTGGKKATPDNTQALMMQLF